MALYNGKSILHDRASGKFYEVEPEFASQYAIDNGLEEATDEQVAGRVAERERQAGIKAEWEAMNPLEKAVDVGTGALQSFTRAAGAPSIAITEWLTGEKVGSKPQDQLPEDQRSALGESVYGEQAENRAWRDPIVTAIAGTLPAAIAGGAAGAAAAGAGLAPGAAAFFGESALTGVSQEAELAWRENRAFSGRAALTYGALDALFAGGLLGAGKVAGGAVRSARGTSSRMRNLMAEAEGAAEEAVGTGARAAGKFANQVLVEEAVEGGLKATGAAVGGMVGGIPGAGMGWLFGRQVAKRFATPIAARVWEHAQSAVKRHGADAAGLGMLAAAALEDDDDTGQLAAAAGLGLFGRRLFRREGLPKGSSLLARPEARAGVSSSSPPGPGVLPQGSQLLGAPRPSPLAAVGTTVADAAKRAGGAVADAAGATRTELGNLAGRAAGRLARGGARQLVKAAMTGAGIATGNPLVAGTAAFAADYVAPRVSRLVRQWVKARSSQPTIDTVGEAVSDAIVARETAPLLVSEQRTSIVDLGNALRGALERATKETAEQRARALAAMPRRLGGDAALQTQALTQAVSELRDGLGQVAGNKIWGGAEQFADIAISGIERAPNTQERFRIGMQLVETLADHTAKAGDSEMAKVFGSYAERFWEVMGQKEIWLGARELGREGKRLEKKKLGLLEKLSRGEKIGAAVLGTGGSAAAAYEATREAEQETQAQRYQRALVRTAMASKVEAARASEFAITGEPSRELSENDRRADKLGVSTQLASFMGRKGRDPQEVVEQRRAMLNGLTQDPSRLVDALADTFGGLAEAQPEAFNALVIQVSRVALFLQAALPQRRGKTIANPNGYPALDEDVQRYAEQWAGAVNPRESLREIAAGTATREQIATVREMWEEQYQDFAMATVYRIQAMGRRGQLLPFWRSQYINTVLDLDGLAEPTLSPQMAQLIDMAGDATQDEPTAPSSAASKSQRSMQPTAIAAMRGA